MVKGSIRKIKKRDGHKKRTIIKNLIHLRILLTNETDFLSYVSANAGKLFNS